MQIVANQCKGNLARLLCAQVRYAEWERNSHTNKVSRLLRLGTENMSPSICGLSQRGSEAGADVFV
jgi:hypothetical protein